MDSHRLVMPEDLNHYGFLFGGRLLSWVDEASWIAASLEFQHCKFVTVGMNSVEFKQQIKQGKIITISSELEKKGTTSVSYHVRVFYGELPESILFETTVSFVNVDHNGHKKSIS